MSNLHPYRLLTRDADTKFRIRWIEEDSNGSDHTFSWGESSLDNSQTIDDPELVEPSSDVYIYDAQVNALDPSTTYEIEIEGETETINEQARTLTDDPTGDGLTLAAFSDPHPWRGDGFFADVDPDGVTLQNIASEDPDAMLIQGDFPASTIECPEEENLDLVLDWFDTYQHLLHENQMIPMIMSVGNHEHGAQWDPREEEPKTGFRCDEEDDGYYYELLFPTSVELDSDSGYNHEITIADQVQILAQDPQTMFPSEIAEWTEDKIRDDVELTIPLNHYGLITGRESDTNEGQTILNRTHLGPIFSNPDYNVPFLFSGHDHNRSISLPIGWQEDEPDSGAYDENEDGTYSVIRKTVADRRCTIDFAGGWPTQRAADGTQTWAYDQLSDSDYEQYYIINITNPTVTIEENDMNGVTQNTYSTDEPVVKNYKFSSLSEYRLGTDSKYELRQS